MLIATIRYRKVTKVQIQKFNEAALLVYIKVQQKYTCALTLSRNQTCCLVN